MRTISSPLLCVGITLFRILLLTLTLLFGSWVKPELLSRSICWFRLSAPAICCLNDRWWFFRGREFRNLQNWSSIVWVAAGVLCDFRVNRRLDVTGHSIIIILLPYSTHTPNDPSRKYILFYRSNIGLIAQTMICGLSQLIESVSLMNE